MTPLVRTAKKLVERTLGTWYEGPEPPDRLRQMVLAYAEAHPRATRREWIGFAQDLARVCYRSGYERGYLWADRDLERRDPEFEPERLAELEGNGWEWMPADQEPAPSGLEEVPEPGQEEEPR